MKKNIVFICLVFFNLISIFAFESRICDALLQIIPMDDNVISVEIPTYDNQNSVSEFTPYLSDKLKTVLTNLGKDVFDINSNFESESFIADMVDAGVYDVSELMNVKRKAPSGILKTSFYEKNSEVCISFSYKKLTGNSKTSSMNYSTKDLPGFEYIPQNVEITSVMNADFENAVSLLNDPGWKVCVSMLDSNNNLLNDRWVYPNEKVRFEIAADEDLYIAIQCINSQGFYEPPLKGVGDGFVPAFTVLSFPHVGGKYYTVVEGDYGTQQVIVYASTTKEGLEAQFQQGKYEESSITKKTRSLDFIVEASEETEVYMYKITYTVLPHKN